MNNAPSIFISYNPGSDFEETLALRLHTIGAVSGINMYLPDRYTYPNVVTAETKNRISISDYYILFSTTSPISKVAKEEISTAFQRYHDKKKIIIIYDVSQGKNLVNTEECTELYFDRHTQTFDQFAGNVLNTITQHSKHQSKTENELLGGLLLAGLGLLVLGNVAANKA